MDDPNSDPSKESGGADLTIDLTTSAEPPAAGAPAAGAPAAGAPAAGASAAGAPATPGNGGLPKVCAKTKGENHEHVSKGNPSPVSGRLPGRLGVRQRYC